MLEVHAPHGPTHSWSAPPEKLNEYDLNELAGKTMEAQGRLVNLRMFLEFEEVGLKQLSQQPGSKMQ
jgi:hypothetical protein